MDLGLMEVLLPGNFLDGLRKPMKNRSLTKTPSEHVQNTCLQRYHYTKQRVKLDSHLTLGYKYV
jgi:hypothetical protein